MKRPKPKKQSPKYEVHPVAALFPMMNEEELQELADDIAQNGLLNAIILDEAERIIDGRNRYEACLLADVEPRFDHLENGIDPRDFIIAQNINRRHMTKGQRAMAVALIYPEPDKRGRGNKGKSSDSDGFSQTRLREARAVLRFSPELAQQVLNGVKSLDEARKDVELYGGDEAARARRLKKLKAEHPDLADAVEEERMSLEDAEKEAQEQVEQLRSLRVTTSRNLLDALNLLGVTDSDRAKELVKLYDPSVASERGDPPLTSERLRKAADWLDALATAWTSAIKRRTKNALPKGDQEEV